MSIPRLDAHPSVPKPSTDPLRRSQPRRGCHVFLVRWIGVVFLMVSTFLLAPPRATAQPPLPLGARAFTENDSTQVSVLLSFSAAEGDSIVETIPDRPGLFIDPDSVVAYTHTITNEPSLEIVRVFPPIDVSPDGRTLTVAGSGYEQIVYRLSAELLPGENIDGRIVRRGQSGTTVEPEDLLGLMQTNVNAYHSAVDDEIRAATDAWAQNLALSQVQEVILENDTCILTGTEQDIGFKDHFPGGSSYGLEAATHLSGPNAHGHANGAWLDMVANGVVSAWVWTGAPFIVRGCDRANPNESGPATFSTGFDFGDCSGLASWSGVHAVFYPVIIPSAAWARTTLTFDVIEWPIVNGRVVGNGVQRNDILANDEAGIPLVCNRVEGSEVASIALTVSENHLYLMRIRLYASGGALGLADAMWDFGTSEDTGLGGSDDLCEGEQYPGYEVVDYGLYTDKYFAQFSHDPFPELAVDSPPGQHDLSVDPLWAGENEEVEICLTIHNYGTDWAPPFEVEFFENGNPIGTCRTDAPLPPCESIDCCITWVSDGEHHSLSAEVDTQEEVLEKCELAGGPPCRHTARAEVRRIPTRATILVLDKSASMNIEYFPNCSRLDVAKTAGVAYVALNFADSNHGPGDAIAVYNFDHEVHADVPITFADEAIGKPAATAAVHQDYGGGDPTECWWSMELGLNEVCPVPTLPRGMIVLTDGCGGGPGDPEVTLRKALMCGVPVVILGLAVDTLDDEEGDLLLPGAGRTQLEGLVEFALDSGGGYLPLPLSCDPAEIQDFIEEILDQLPGLPGWVALPVGRRFVRPGGIGGPQGQFAGAITLSVVQEGLPLPGSIEVNTIGDVRFDGIPTIQSVNLDLDLGSVLLSNGDTRLTIPLIPGQTSGDETGVISIGGVNGIRLDVGSAPGEISLNLLGLPAGGGDPVFERLVTVAVGTYDIVVNSIFPEVGFQGEAHPVTIEGLFSFTLSDVTLRSATNPALTYELDFPILVDPTEISAVVPAGVAPGHYHVIVSDGIRSNDVSQMLYLSSEFMTIGLSDPPDARGSYGTGVDLHVNRPNPFNPVTWIRYDLPESLPVRITILDVSGRRVRTLVDLPMQEQGQHSIRWDGLDQLGRETASGVYFYRLEAGRQVATRRMLLLR